MAAGQSNRFGDRDKLTAKLGGKMLGQHVADNLKSLSFRDSVIIAPSGDHPCAEYWRETGYDILVNEDASKGQATSVSLAAWHAQSLEASALLICLADMPFISAAHITQLVTTFESRNRTQIIASSDGRITMPPAIFPASHFAEMANLSGDKGARNLLTGAEAVVCEKSNMLDIDTPDDLIAAEILL